MPDLSSSGSGASDSVASAVATSAFFALDSDFDLGRSALLEITSAESIGAPAGSIDSGEGVTTVYFETLLSGYPGWRWTVSIAHLDNTPASVLETELTPGDDALLSPAWVPWTDRLADLTAAQDAAAAEDDSDNDSDDDSDNEDSDHDESDETDLDESDDDDDDDDDEDDDEDDDDFGSDVLHGGDLDGVDIDDLDDVDDPDGSDEDDPEDEHERSV